MLKRLTAAAVGVVGLVVIGLGIASATVWRADDVLVATTSGGAHTLVTDPGVLELGGDPVTVKVTVPDGGDVVLVVGRDTDVAGWVGSDAHGQVTGLSAWHTLAVDDVEAPVPTPSPTDAAATEPAPADAATPAPTEATTEAAPTAADPTGSDLWVAEQTGAGSAELVWQAREGRWSLLAVSTGESPPTLSMAWPRVVTTPWLWPCVAVGTVLVLVAAWLLLRGARRRRAGLDEPRWHAVTTGATPVVVSDDIDAIPVLTRRQMREAAQSHSARPRSGAVPQVPAPTAAPAGAPAPARTEPSRDPVPTGASASGAAGSGGAAGALTSRRALRPPTGAIPVTTAAEPGTRAAGWAPAASSTTGRAPGTPPPSPGRPSGAPVGPGSDPGRPTGAPSGPGYAPGAPGRPTGAPGGPGYAPGAPGAPGRPTVAPGGPGYAPGAPGRPTGAPGGPGYAPGASGRPTPAPGEPSDAPGRPTGAAGGPGYAPGAPGRATGAPDGPSAAPGRAVDAPGGPGYAPGRPTGAAGGPGYALGAPGRPTGGDGGPGYAPGRPTPTPGGQSGVSAGPSSAANQGSAAPHGRPSWVRGTAGSSPAASTGAGTTPVTEPDRSGPTGWSAVPPPPGARVRPGSPAGPDSVVHAGRPAWARPATGESPPADDSAASGSRADAWRRAWGLPPTEGTPEGTQNDTDSRGEQR